MSEAEAAAIQRVAVIGAGLMGHGIALEFAVRGYTVTLHDRTEALLESALRRAEGNLTMLRHAGLVTAAEADGVPGNLRATTGLEDAVAGADLVVEAVFEDLPLKQGLFRDLDRLAPPRAILASNTSTFMPSLLAAATGRPEQVLVTHYFNPPYLLPLVEIVPGERTSEETVATVRALLVKIGKRPALVRKEVPGFVGNRLQAALLREALSIVAQGIASAEDVDAIIKNGFGRRLSAAGVFEVFDIAGWDLLLAIAEQLFPAIESSPDVPPLLREKVERGELGVKTGQGFYSWTPESAEALRARIARALAGIPA